METIKMQACPSFNTCDAPLCPLDPELDKRVWFTDEDICKSKRHGSGVRWIKKQRSIVKRQTKNWLNRPVTHQQLYDNSRPRQMSDAKRAELKERLAKARKLKKAA